MLQELQKLKITLMKARKEQPELKDKLTLKINALNDVFTAIKTVAVNKKTTVDHLSEKDVVSTLQKIAKQLDKEIEAYGAEHPKAQEAKYAQDFLNELVPEAYQKASTGVMDAFIAEQKSKGLTFKDIMAEAKKQTNFDMKYIAQNAK